jgi:lipopolysaccharide export system protein LptC
VTSRNILTLCGLLIIAVGSWYLASTSREDEITKTVTDTRFGGYYLRSARILGTDDNGLLLYEIKAEYAEQQENNEIRLQNVHISYSTGAEVPWSVSADVAMVSDSLDVLRLSGHVVAISDEGFSGQVTEIRTPRLDIDPMSYRAETDSRVQIRIGSRSLTATGMLALLQENQLQLKSNVSGKFVP